MKQTLGEKKTGTCEICHAEFPKARYDQKFCSRPCRAQAKLFYKRIVWSERADQAKQNAARKVRYHANKEANRAKVKAYRAKNKELLKVRNRAYYLKNKQVLAEKTRAYKRAHPEIARKSYWNERQRRPWQRSLLNARHRAQKHNFAFDLTREWCEAKWTGLCELTNLPFDFGTSTHYPFSPSIDRINSSIGYIQSNCRFVLFSVNSFKGVGTDEQMLSIAKALVQNAAPERL